MAKKILIGVLDLLLLALVVAAAGVFMRFAWLNYYRAAFPVKYEAQVKLQSELAGVAPSLLFAVIHTESGFDPLAESYVPARGLMQLTQETFEWVRYRIGDSEHITYDDMFDPEINIRYGAQLLRLLQDEFGSVQGSLSAYHMGWGTVKGWLKNPDYTDDSGLAVIPSATARRYIDKVLHTEKIYNELYNFKLYNYK